MKTILACVSALLVLSIAAQNSYGQTQYSLTELNVNSASRDMLAGLNNLGQVVGQPTGSLQYGWRWDNGTFTELGALGTGESSAAADINDSGQIVGLSAILSGNTTSHAFYYDNGTMYNLTLNSTGLTNVAQNFATGINANADVTGTATADGRPGVLWDVDTADPLNGTTNITFSTFRKPMAINDNGDAVGATLNFEEGLLREASGTLFGLGQIPGSTFHGSWARDISNSRLAVGGGWFADNGNVRHAARWDKNLVTGDYEIYDLHSDILQLASTAHSSDALAVNELDQIVGWYAVDADDRAVLWDPTFGSLELYDLLLDNKGWTGLDHALDINELGQILVTGRDSNGQDMLALLTPIPEPSSCFILGVLVGVFVLRRKR